jgi:hypothetical protein
MTRLIQSGHPASITVVVYADVLQQTRDLVLHEQLAAL